MRKPIHAALIFLFASIHASAQELNVPVQQYKVGKWNAAWITHPDVSSADYSVVLFRKKLILPNKPGQYIINVTADNRYKLFVNGKPVCRGPQLSDVRHWRYETLDIASFLNAGENTVAAEVVNFGKDRFFGQMSVRTAFLLNGFSEREKDINTNATWKAFINTAFSAEPVNWMGGVDITGGFYASNPGDSVNANFYPWGWAETTYNDSGWQAAKWFSNAAAFGGSFYWMLMPRTTPLQTDSVERFASVARSTGTEIGDDFLSGKKSLTIPANTKVRLLIDQKRLTVGYPLMHLSGGKAARIKITYAENLFGEGNKRTNRNVTEGKTVHGLHDAYVMDGGTNRVFTSLWMRSFRFIQVEIETQSEALTINDYYNVYSAAPVPAKAAFYCDDESYLGIMDICRRTALICTQDNFMSDAYYEQMQYVGDSRVHAAVHLALTGNDVFMRNAIEQFNYSRLPDGNITSCYPLKSTFVHPTFSLLWIDMLEEYAMYRGDKDFIRRLLPTIPFTFSWFENHLNKNGLMGGSEWQYFVDWYDEKSASSTNGFSRVSENGNSALITLHYIYTLQNASKIFAFMGKASEAALYKQRAEALKKKVYALCFDAGKGLMAEDPAKTFFDQRVNIMAVLTDAVPERVQKSLMEKILRDTSLNQAGLYYRYNLFLAVAKTRTGYLLKEALKPWQVLLDSGMTTTPEVPLNMKMQRSECHPWSTGPAWAFFGVACGIQPAAMGFASVTIAPDLSNLKFINAVYSHPKGDVVLRLKKVDVDGVSGEVILPKGLAGKFIWKGQSMALKEGKQMVAFPAHN